MPRNAKSALSTHSKDKKMKSRINLLCSIHISDEIKPPMPLWCYNIRSSEFLLINKGCNAIGIVWPEMITYKLSNTPSREKLTCFKNKVKIQLLYDNLRPNFWNPVRYLLFRHLHIAAHLCAC